MTSLPPIDLGSEVRDRVEGMRAAPTVRPEPSPAELRRAREMALTERLEARIGGVWVYLQPDLPYPAAALNYAADAHQTQLRKGTPIPYLSHLLGVASLVLEHGGDEDQAIAGLLHDVLEDAGPIHAPL